MLYAVKPLWLFGESMSTITAAGKNLIIFVTATPILLFNEPYNDFPESFFESLNLTDWFFSNLDCVIGADSSIFKSSKVKKSENGFVLKFLASLSGIVLSRAKFVLVNWLVPSVIWTPTKLSLKVCDPLAAWLGTLYFAIIIQ